MQQASKIVLFLADNEQHVFLEGCINCTGSKCCDEDEVMEIESLDEDPQIVSHDDVVEESEYKFAGPVLFIKSPKNSYKVDKHVLTFSSVFVCDKTKSRFCNI